MTDTENGVHISIVLDRSGSMNHIAEYVVAGFNRFLVEQRKGSGEARLTLVQFDSEDPFEVLIDSAPLAEVADLAPGQYEPRAMTPLYDAVGTMIIRTDAEIARRSMAGLPEEDQVVLVVTDGLENASSDFTGDTVAKLVEERRAAGWVFVFLGADQDVVVEGAKLGVAERNRAGFVKTKKGVDDMWDDLAGSTTNYREKVSAERRAAREDYLKKDDETE